MMFSDDKHRARACLALLRPCFRGRVGHLFTLDGPTDRARELAVQDGGPLSAGERLMFIFAMEVWGFPPLAKRPGIASAIATLDAVNLERLGNVLAALAHENDLILLELERDDCDDGLMSVVEWGVIRALRESALVKAEPQEAPPPPGPDHSSDGECFACTSALGHETRCLFKQEPPRELRPAAAGGVAGEDDIPW